MVTNSKSTHLIKNRSIFPYINGIIMLILIVITVYPFIYVIMASFSDAVLLAANAGAFLIKPFGFSLEGYKIVLRNPNILIGYKNTLIYVTLGTSINLAFTILGAFVLSRRKFMLKKIMIVMIIITMYFSGGMIPRFIVVQSVGLYDTIWALLIPNAISTWNLIIMRTSFNAIPHEMEEAAKIDGANDLQLLFRVVIPLSVPVIAVMALFYGVGHWNAWFDSMIFIRNTRLYPLQLFLREILIMEQMGEMTSPEVIDDFFNLQLVKYCSIVISTVPILCIYPLLQKYFVKGIMVGALKG